MKEWGRLRRAIEEVEGTAVSDRALHDILATLKKHTIIDENLEYADPIVKEAALTL